MFFIYFLAWVDNDVLFLCNDKFNKEWIPFNLDKPTVLNPYWQILENSSKIFSEILAFTTSGSVEKNWYFFELVNSVHKFFRRKQEHVVTPCSEHVLELSFQRPDS